MIELSKYIAHVLAAYGITVAIIISISLYTFFDFRKTKKQLNDISQNKTKP